MSATPPDVSRRAPLLGEHTDEVLREAGFSGCEIAALRAVRRDRGDGGLNAGQDLHQKAFVCSRRS